MTTELFLKRWRFIRLSRDRVVIWDEKNQIIKEIPDYLFQLLLHNEELLKGSLDDTLRSLNGVSNLNQPQNKQADLPHQTTLKLLGANILIRCLHAQCLQDIKAYFPNFEDPFVCSPDVIVDCLWKKSDERLFVHRLQNDAHPFLEGVRVHSFGSISMEDWPYLSPPIPPLEVQPFHDKFVGVHAAVIETPDGSGLLIVGPRGAGKTTSAIRLVNKFNCKLLTDELAFIHKRTRLVEPYSRPLKLRDGTRNTKILPASQVCETVAKEAVLITHTIILYASYKNAGELIPASADVAFKHLLDNHQDVGCNMDESILTLMHLARDIPAAIYHYKDLEQLLNGAPRFIEFSQMITHGSLCR